MTSTVTSSGLLEDLLALPPEVRREVLAGLSVNDLALVYATCDQERGTPFAIYRDDPVGFTQHVLGETIWSRQAQILEALADQRWKRVAVPAGFGVGKTHIAARATAHFLMTRPIGTALAVTTATRMRQVQRQLWPHIRKLHARSHLPGLCDTIQWKIPDENGVETIVAYGFSAPDNDEAAMQGIHAAALLLIVDEAGGFGHLLGSSTSNLLTGDARMLAIGNPPSDNENSWFERLCADGEDESRADTVTIRIAAADSPAVTGENSGPCQDCPATVPLHPLAQHLVDQQWIDDAIREHGERSPYVIAKVWAKFPRGGAARVIPFEWAEAAVDRPEPVPDEDEEWVRLDELGLPDERDGWLVQRGDWVRLGVDVAADGGDELVIARSIGNLVTIQHAAAGSENANAMDVAGRVLLHIRRAEALAAALGCESPVRVKIDAIGVGWGVASTLTAWGKEELHGAEIVAVNVSEAVNRPPDGSTMIPGRKRDEMWLAGRQLLQPGPRSLVGSLRLRVAAKTVAQLSAPTYGSTSGGLVQVESKKSMKGRGVHSPDQAEALLLAVYEPVVGKKRKKARVLFAG